MSRATELRPEVRRVITNAYYDCRNEGETMETAADRAADAVMAVVAHYEAAVEALERLVVAKPNDPGAYLRVRDVARAALARLRDEVPAGGPMTLRPLERYGRHDMECRKRAGAERFYGQSPCSCGLDDAIAALPREGLPAIDPERLAEAWGNVMDGRRVEGVRLYPGVTTNEDWQSIIEEYTRLASENVSPESDR